MFNSDSFHTHMGWKELMCFNNDSLLVKYSFIYNANGLMFTVTNDLYIAPSFRPKYSFRIIQVCYFVK